MSCCEKMFKFKKIFSSMSAKMNAYPAKVEDLKEILSQRSGPSSLNHLDEVYPGIFLGDSTAAKDCHMLESSGVTHVLNMAQGTGLFLFVDTDEKYYTDRNSKVQFKGIPAVDLHTFDLSIYFEEATQFILSALKNNGKVLVHCLQGVSRSATVVIVYLMMKENMTAVEAIKWIRRKRNIHPNDGFLQQVCELEAKLDKTRKKP